MSSEEDLTLKRSSNRGRRTIFKVVTFPFAVILAIVVLAAYVGGAIFGWVGVAQMLYIWTKDPQLDLEQVICDDGPTLGIFRAFSALSVCLQCLDWFVSLLARQPPELPHTGLFMTAVLFYPVLCGLWRVYSHYIDNYMGVK